MRRSAIQAMTYPAIALLVCLAGPAGAAVLGPYLPDGSTVLLYHLDDAAGGSVAANAVPGGRSAITFDGVPIASAGPITTALGAAGYFGTSASLAARDTGVGYDANNSGTFVPEGASASPDRILWSSLVGAGNAFTCEAMINVPAISGGTNTRMIMSLEGNVGTRAWMFRFETNGDLRFFNINNGSGPRVAVPITGDHAFVPNEWFHVAMVFDGTSAQLYWTRVADQHTQANPLGGPAALTYDGTRGGVLIFGNEGRVDSTEGLGGLIDEVRISNVARAPTEFIFGAVANRPPAVSAGTDQSILLTPGVLNLNATVGDDGLPNPPGAVTTRWTVDSQPAASTVTFADDTQPATSVTLDMVGTYVLRLTACDDGTPGACAGLEGSDTLTVSVEPGYIWDGGDASSDNWTAAPNWVNDLSPLLTGGASTLVFSGAARLSPSNDATDADLKAITFDAGAGAFQLLGNGMTVRTAIANNGAQLQTVNTGGIALSPAAVVSATAGALRFDAGLDLGAGQPSNINFQGAFGIELAGAVTGLGTINKLGVNDLLLSSNLNAYRGGTQLNEGSVTAAANNALGASPPDPSLFTFVDAVGGAGGNTVRASDDDPSAWIGPDSGIDGLWAAMTYFSTGVYEAGSSAENAPQLKTTISGLTPGETYTVAVLFWSRGDTDWPIRAGLSSGTMILFNRSGAAVGAEAAVAGTFTRLTAGDGLMQLLGVLGTAVADASGQIPVYVDDLPSTGSATRTRYDGVSYVQGTLPTPGAATTIAGVSSTAVLQLSGNMIAGEPIGIGGRQPTENPASHIRNIAGDNTLTREITMTGGGNEYVIESAAGQLSIQDVINLGGGTGTRYLYLRGAGNGVVNGAVRDGTGYGDLPVTKRGTGTWTFTNNNPDVDSLTIAGGTVSLAAASANNLPDAAITVAAGATLNVSGLAGGGIQLNGANRQSLLVSGAVTGKVTLEANTTLGAGVAIPAGGATISSGLSLADGSKLKVRLLNGSNSLSVTGGSLVGAGAGGVSLEIDATDAVAGTYTLIDWTGASASGVDVADFVLAGPQAACLPNTLRIQGSKLLFDLVGPPLLSGLVDDFQSYALGSVDTLIDAPWQAVPEGGNTQVAIGDDGTTRYLGVQMSAATGDSGRGAYRPLGCHRIPDGQTRTLFFRWLASAATSLNHYVGLADASYSPNPTGAGLPLIDDLRLRVRIGQGTGGTVTMSYSNGTADVSGRTGLLTNTWYNVWVVVHNNPEAGTDVADYYLNTGAQSGNPVTDLVAANVPLRGQVAADLARIAAIAWTSGAQNIVRVDDINVRSGATLEYPFPFGGFDFDNDGMVDVDDVLVFINCSNGAEVPVPPAGCTIENFNRADADDDGDVDGDDFGRFQLCFSGSAPADASCGSW